MIVAVPLDQVLAHLRAENVAIQAGPVSRSRWTDAVRLFPRSGRQRR